MILILWITFAFAQAMFAASRGEYGVPYFIVSFFLSPIAGWVILQMRLEILNQDRHYNIQLQLAALKDKPGPHYIYI